MLDFSGLDNTSGAFPSVTAKNSSGPKLRDGTPVNADLVNDIWGAFQAILSAAGTTPSDSVETSSASDLLDSIRKLGGAPGEIVFHASPSDVIAANILPLKGQVITIASYSKLVAATYIGDAYNSEPLYTTFYKCSDTGGVTRNTAGPYFKLPDCRGYSVRALQGAATGRDAAREYLTNTYFQDYRNMSGHQVGDSPGWHIHDVVENSAGNGLTLQTGYLFTSNPGAVTGTESTVTPTFISLYKRDVAASGINAKIGKKAYPIIDYSTTSFYDEVRPANVAFQLGIRY